MESQFERTTSECRDLSDLRPEMLATLRAVVEKFELGYIESNVLACFETTSVPQKKHGRPPKVKEGDVQHTGIVVTPEIVFWIVGWKKEVHVYWARLKGIEVGDYRNSTMNAMATDQGIDIFGFVMLGRERGSAFIGLGEGPAAEKLRVTLGEAVEKAGGTWER